MKKMLIMLVMVFTVTATFGYQMSQEHINFLENALNNYSFTRSANVGVDRNSFKNNLDGGFLIGFSETFINSIISKHVQHEALKKFDLYLRDGSYVIDAVIYFDLLDLDIPLTIVGSFDVPTRNNIYMDVKEAKVWAEGNLPTHTILEKVIDFIGKNTEISKFVHVGFEAVSTRYNQFGRIILVPRLKDIAPSIPDINITGARTFNEEIVIKGK